MNINLKSINTSDLLLLRNRFNEFTFNQDFTFIYEKQVPNAAVILISGEIVINKKSDIKIIPPGFVIGLQNLLKNIPFKFDCNLRGSSSVLLLPKSDILKILNNKKSPLYPVIQKIIV